MKDPIDKLVCAMFGLFGAALGFLVYAMALGGWRFVLLGHATKAWNGLAGLIISCAVGGVLGLVSYRFRDREFGSGDSDYYDSPATAILFSKRLIVIVTCLVGLYFLWQLAK